MGLGHGQISSGISIQALESMKISSPLHISHSTHSCMSVYSLLNTGFVFFNPLIMASLTSCVCNMAAFHTAV
jgi:hypothetical protein